MANETPKLLNDASVKVIFPITGMLGGLLIGILLVMVQGPGDEIKQLHQVIQFAAALIAVAAAICWFGSRILVEALAW